jgi:dCTP deaminase
MRKFGRMSIDPFDPGRIEPNSYDLTLAADLKVYQAGLVYARHAQTRWRPYDLSPAGRGQDDHVLDMRRDNPTVDLVIPETGVVLYPGVVYLGRTVEWTETRAPYVPKLDGRSSVGRLGMCIHLTAGAGDVGFRGRWTMEITVVHPLRVYPHAPVCQIYYEETCGEILEYAGRYQDSDAVVASRFHRHAEPAA